MAALTPSELLQWLADNQFLPMPQVEELRGLLPTLPEKHGLVKELIRRSWLTPYQANQIVTDKASSLVMGPYRLMERLGEGAMGQVFKAWDVRMGRFVAVKMIHKDHLASAKAMDRFRQEMGAAGKLDHRHIVLVRNAGDEDNRPFIAMDYFEGINLSQLVKNEGPLPVHVGCEYVRQTALGLEHACEHGVVHRDLKPGNLLLTQRGPDDPGVVKILDFGLARSVDDGEGGRLTQVGRIIGTVDYVSPEQVENAQKADIRSDIYSLGCTLFFLLTAKPPFSGTTLEEKLYGRLMGQVPSLRSVRPEVPEALETVLQRTMARNPNDRYQRPEEVALALEPFCHPHAPAKDMAQGIPLAQPVPSGPAGTAMPRILVAQPVGQGTAPAPQVVSQAAGPGDLFSFGHSTEVPPEDTASSELDPDLPAPQEAVTFRGLPKGPGKLRLYGVIAGAVVTMVLLVYLGKWMLQDSGKKVAYPGGSLRVMPLNPIQMKEGERKTVIVRVNRQGFQGPVKVEVKNPPDGVTVVPVTIPSDRDKGELYITASFTIGAMKVDLKVLARAQELEATEELPLTVVSLKSQAPFSREPLASAGAAP